MGVYRAIRAWKVANPDVLPILDDGMWRPSGPPGDRGVLREVGSKGRLNQTGHGERPASEHRDVIEGRGARADRQRGRELQRRMERHRPQHCGWVHRSCREPERAQRGDGGGDGARPFRPRTRRRYWKSVSALHLNEDDYVERHASRRVRVEHSHRAAYNAEHLLKDADARRVEVRRMEGAMGDHGSDGVGRGSDDVPESGWTRNPLHHRDEDDEDDGRFRAGTRRGGTGRSSG